ncbi:MAG TPA: putative Ig domain-containing protein [Candidatus Kapabacteria bacterium]|nr:putative Ig domain-containing protein [Candidatus Kapabacteria bacterium]
MNNLYQRFLVSFLTLISVLLIISCEPCKFEGIAPDDIPVAKIGSDYSTVFKDRTSVCSPSRVYIFVENGSLPPGLTLYPNGELKGKISNNAEAKVYNFTIKMEVCFAGQASTGYSDCTSLSKGYALKVENK